MFRNRLYYWLKPHLPWRLRMGLRRWFAQRKRERVREVWPILPGSERPPVGWPGWPGGKKFAFVLSHDIEGAAGVKKVRPLAELEMRLGFRSCFNFTPEGDHAVPGELRDWLVRNGFEVGVHDLKHDGKLYQSRAVFQKHAVSINRYFAEWGAVGFRSGFMMRNLDWHHDLNLQYDSSTFDTDPFEPQPDGVGTIFPFWIPNPNLGTATDSRPSPFDPRPPASGQGPSSVPSSAICPPSSDSLRPGYVELPYTLPQDSTLFLLLRERTPNIWLQKFDWISQHGGMAMVNVHPDYIQFDGEQPSGRTYPVEYFMQLLRCPLARFSGQFWGALPRDVCAFWNQAVLRNASSTDSIVQARRWNSIPVRTPEQLRAPYPVGSGVGLRRQPAAPSVI